MVDYFKKEHLELLSKWKGQKYDKSDPEQNRAYDELKDAYEVIASWANKVKEILFPEGNVDIVKRPTNQGNHFAGYLWAKIYPSSKTPKQLAYTISVEPEYGFVVKIDTVNADHNLRQRYEKIRGSYEDSSIVVVLAAEDGLSKSLPELVSWTVEAIGNFKLVYDEIATKLNLDKNQLQENPIEPGAYPNTAATREANQPIIYYGPPGTGKTYQLTQLLQGYTQSMASISHEEWRRQFIAERIAALTWWEAIVAALHDLGGQAKVGKLFEHPFIQAIATAKSRTRNVKQTLWGTLQHHTVEDSKTVNIKLRLAPAVFDKTEDSVWKFSGSWQEDCADIFDLVKVYRDGPPASEEIKRYRFVTFHPSYGYEEFVEGLRPVLGGDSEAAEVQYEIRPGVFKELCDLARQEKGQRFAMVIDEINRGNISKIFGELITLIEPDKREGKENAISVRLPYSGQSFSVPVNIDIIGTMNTADRSLALLDTALRRRFDFVPLMPDTRDEAGAPLAGLFVTTAEGDINVRLMLQRINERIEILYDRDHCIGHAYLTELKDIKEEPARFEALQVIFRNRILPLLEEYFFEDWGKIRLVLGDNQKQDQALQFVIQTKAHEQRLIELFGNDHGLDDYATQRCYRVQDTAFCQPAAYIGIYK